MVDLLVFSRDRAFQLHTALETIKKHITGINNIFVQFSYSNEDYLRGYQKLYHLFDDVVFIDETKYGFNDTLAAIIGSEIKTETIAFEVDDSIYYRNIDISKCSDALLSNDKVGRYLYAGDYKIFGLENFIEVNEQYALVDRRKDYGRDVINICLKYAFNVSSAIHKRKDVLELLQWSKIDNPINLEHKGTESPIFNKYSQTMVHTVEVFKQAHLNNFMKRYEETSDVEELNRYFLNGEIIDIDLLSKSKIESMEMDMRWFNGEDIGRFPIFPWEIPPVYHQKILDNRKKLSKSLSY
jgi:hypothetical protein